MAPRFSTALSGSHGFKPPALPEVSDYKFHFVISYIHAHTPAGLIDEFHADRIMEYVNDHWNLFDVCA